MSDSFFKEKNGSILLWVTLVFLNLLCFVQKGQAELLQPADQAVDDAPVFVAAFQSLSVGRSLNRISRRGLGVESFSIVVPTVWDFGARPSGPNDLPRASAQSANSACFRFTTRRVFSITTTRNIHAHTLQRVL